MKNSIKNQLLTASIYLIFILFILSVISIPIFSQSQSRVEKNAVNLLLLIDSSGSMRQTDPQDIRKMAAQSIVSFLSEKDKVAVVEFDADARVLCDWKEAINKEDLFKIINKAGNQGAFTDFRVGLEKALDLTAKAEKERRTVILVLSDGLFEPNLASDAYAPYNLGYVRSALGKSGAEKKRIQSEYRKKILPVAKRKVESEQLPKFREQKVEIFTLAFSPNSDQMFLREMADYTNLNKPEVHNFYAEKATDLVEVFTNIASYWKNLIIAHQETGEIRSGVQKDIFLDEFLNDAFFVVFVEKSGIFQLEGEDGRSGKVMPETHPNLKIHSVGKQGIPGRWMYSFTQGDGRYLLLIVGENRLELDLHGLKSQYLYGELVEASIYVKVGGQNAISSISSDSIIETSLWFEGRSISTVQLERNRDNFDFEYTPQRPGNYQIRFKLLGRDRNGREILPRPSRDYEFRVMPNFFVTPERLDFGDLKKGKSKGLKFNVHSGMPSQISVKVRGNILYGSHNIDKKDKLPNIEETTFTIKSGEVLEKDVVLNIPKNGSWGDYEGEILFEPSQGQVYTIEFRVHIPSWREWVTKAAILFLILIIGILIYLGYIWGKLGTPHGVMRYLKTPAGVIKSDVSLSRIKRGRITNLINYKRHIVTIASKKADIILKDLPAGLRIQLRFYRFGGNYIRNSSLKASTHTILVVDPISQVTIKRRNSQYYRLRTDTKIEFEGYEVIFKHI